ncbi:hypothetical protein F5887DRAFT_990091 [Amanita rubescens]|nr:hypothetical protein F5887DRAFT_990091 [Amanita rubescens]
MLFLYALLCFALGTSVAAIPAALTTPPLHVSRRGILDKLKPKINVAKRIEGVWICKDRKQEYYNHVLKITQGTIVEIWPPGEERGIRTMLCITEWSRATTKDIKKLEGLPADSGVAISVSDSPRFSRDKIKTSWVSGNNIRDYTVTVQLKGRERDPMYVPLRIVDELETGSDM